MLLVGLGGIFGAVLRFLLGSWITNKSSGLFPFGTWIVNISGSFALGLIFVLHSDHIIPEWSWLLFGTGFLGAFTTFSTFSYEVVQMLSKNAKTTAVIYITSSVLLAILFAALGGFIANIFIV